jgi:hypothetical protein
MDEPVIDREETQKTVGLFGEAEVEKEAEIGEEK